LTWPITLGAFISLALLIFLSVTFIPSDRPLMPFNVSLTGSILLLCCLALCIMWHRQKRNRPDTADDLLARIFPAQAIMQTGRVHCVAVGFQSGGIFRLVVGVQNLFDQPTEFRCSFANAGTLPDLACTLGESQVIVGKADFPIANSDLPAKGHLTITASAQGHGGTQVRFATRRAFKGRSQTVAVSVALAAGGHFHLDRSTTEQPGLHFANVDGNLPAPLVPFESSARQAPAPTWSMRELWGPRKPQAPAKAAVAVYETVHAPR
jgi:hypothetical protein